MVLDFNLKEGEGEKKNKIGDKKVESLKEKEIEKEVKQIYGKIIILDKEGRGKDVNVENGKCGYGYVGEGLEKVKKEIENKKKSS